MTIPSFDGAGQDYILRALTSARSSGFGIPAYGTLGPNPTLVSTIGATRVTTAAITCNAPATITAGNLLIAVSIHTTSSATYTPPAGWTQVNRLSASNGVATFFTKVATGSEPANYTFTASAAAGQNLYILNYSNAGGVLWSNFAAPGEPVTVSTPVYPNSRLFTLVFDGSNNPSGFTTTTGFAGSGAAGSFPQTIVATVVSSDPAYQLLASNLLFDVTEKTNIDTYFNVANTSSGSLVSGCVIPKEQLTYLDVFSVSATVTTTAWQTTTRTVVAGNPNTTLYVDSGDIQLSKDNISWSNYVSVSIGDTVYIRSRVVDSNNLVAGIQTLNVYCRNEEVIFQYILDANIVLSSTANLSTNTALNYVYEPTGRTVTLAGTDTITASGGQVRKNSTGTWGTSVSVVSGDTLNFRVTASDTRDVIRTCTISSTRKGASLFTVSANTTSYISYTGAGTSTFTVPLGVTSVCVACIGAGGGGATVSPTAAGGGGGGGALSYTNNISVTSGSTHSCVRGAGGAVGTGGGAAGNGGTTSVTTLGVSANGGSGASGATGGAGGTTGGSGAVKFAGGAGSSASSNKGGGGGGAATQASAGTAGTTSVTEGFGGNGGSGTYTTSSSWGTGAGLAGIAAYGGSGQTFGGGSGGGAGNGTTEGNAYAGADGAITIIWNGRTFSSSSSF